MLGHSFPGENLFYLWVQLVLTWDLISLKMDMFQQKLKWRTHFKDSLLVQGQ